MASGGVHEVDGGRATGFGYNGAESPSHPRGERLDLPESAPPGAECARAGLEDMRIQDLRHSFASEAVMGGQSLPMVGRILGHTQAQTTARYAHLADDPLQRASERVASSLKQAMDG